jgi:asparagine synthase (glutamine-hydrolysing)
MGYMYWNNAPTPRDAHDESIRRLEEIYLYDGLRVDRALGWFGLEARLPYLDKGFVEFYTNLPAETRVPTPTRMEKHILRRSFAEIHPGILPERVLWRRKEAFSDGVSPAGASWFRTIQAWMDERITDEEFHNHPRLFPEDPPTKEAYYYQKKFLEFFGKENIGVIPAYWMPRWSGDAREPSARVLPCYTATATRG